MVALPRGATHCPVCYNSIIESRLCVVFINIIFLNGLLCRRPCQFFDVSKFKCEWTNVILFKNLCIDFEFTCRNCRSSHRCKDDRRMIIFLKAFDYGKLSMWKKSQSFLLFFNRFPLWYLLNWQYSEATLTILSPALDLNIFQRSLTRKSIFLLYITRITLRLWEQEICLSYVKFYIDSSIIL